MFLVLRVQWYYISVCFVVVVVVLIYLFMDMYNSRIMLHVIC